MFNPRGIPRYPWAQERKNNLTTALKTFGKRLYLRHFEAPRTQSKFWKQNHRWVFRHDFSVSVADAWNRMLSPTKNMPATKNYDRLIANLQHKPGPDSLVTTNWPIPWHETSAIQYLESLEFCHRVSLPLWHFHQKQMPSNRTWNKKNMIETTRVFPSMASRVANVIVHLYSAKTTATPPKLRMSQLQWRRILRHWVFFWGVGCWSGWFHGANGVYIGFDYTLSLIEYPACWTTWKLKSYYLITN